MTAGTALATKRLARGQRCARCNGEMVATVYHEQRPIGPPRELCVPCGAALASKQAECEHPGWRRGIHHDANNRTVYARHCEACEWWTRIEAASAD